MAFTPIVSTTVTGETVENGSQSIILGGIANSGTINTFGSQNIGSGGMANFTTVNGGLQNVLSGGIANSGTINTYGSQNIVSGGMANFTTVNSGLQNVFSGGVASNTLVDSQGAQVIKGGVANYTVINNASWQLVYNDGVANSTTLNYSGWQGILSSGIANSTTINSASRQYVNSGGVANFVIVNSGGEQLVWGVTNSTTVNSGGRYCVDGGSANGITQQAGAAIIALTNATITGGTNTRVDGHNAFSIVAGIASNFLLENGGLLYVMSGHSAVNTVIAGGGNVVYDGGVVSLTTIFSGGMQYISSGGMANSTAISSGGVQSVYGLATSTTIGSGGVQSVYGGSVTSTTISSGGVQRFEGGSATSTTIKSGGTMTLGTALGTVAATVILQQSGAAIIIEASIGSSTITRGTNARAGEFGSFSLVDGIASNFLLENGGAMYCGVSLAVNTLINSGGVQEVWSTCTANSTTINSGGSQKINSGGVASGTIVNANGEMFVVGGIANDTIVNSGGVQSVYWGSANFTTINFGGVQDVDGTANSTIINSGGVQDVDGTANSTTINSGGSQKINSGGVASGTIVNANGEMFVDGMANDTIVSSGGIMTISAGWSANMINQQSGGAINANTLTTITGGTNTRIDGHSSFSIINYTASNFLLENGGSLTVGYGHYAVDTVINSGDQYVSSGGVADLTIINNAGKQSVSSGGAANNTTINSGGNQYVGGVANSTTLNGGKQIVYSGGMTNSTTLNGGSQDVESGGVTSDTKVKAGANMYVSSGGIASGILMIAGGHVTVEYSDNLEASAMIFKLGEAKINDTLLTIMSGVVGDIGQTAFTLDVDNAAIGTYILSSGADLTGMSGATFSVADNGQNVNVEVGKSYIFADGDKLTLSFTDGATDQLTAILSSSTFTLIVSTTVTDENVVFGTQSIIAGGVANYTDINNSGYQNISSGGIASATLINSNGNQNISSGGLANSTMITSDGWQNIWSGGLASNTKITSDGLQNVYSGGLASNTMINFSGEQEIYYGGIARTTIVSAGDQAVSSGGVASNTTVNSMGQQYVEGIASQSVINSGGMLMIGNGGKATGFTMSSGGILGWDFNAVFSGTSNGVTVTSSSGSRSYNLQLWDSQIVSSGYIADSATVGYSSVQTIKNGGVANYTKILTEGYQYVSSGGVANSTTINFSGTQEILSGGSANTVFVNAGGSMYISSGGNFSGTMTLDGGHVTVDHPGNFMPSAVNIKLANAQANEAIMTILANVTDTNGTAMTLDVSNTTTGLYILSSGINLTGMNGATFAVKDGGQTVNVKVGSSYTFTDGDKLTLSFTDGVTDKVTASFSVNAAVVDITPPAIPTGLKMTFSENAMNIDWNDSTDASGIKRYEVWGDEYADFSTPEENGYHNTVTESKDAIVLDSQLVGTFYMKVRAMDNSGNWSAWSSTASLTATGTLAVNSSTNDWVGSTDVYKLTLDNAGTLSMSLTGLTGNADLSLSNAAGTVLKTSANTETNPEAINNVTLLAGTYYVKVSPAGKAYTEYALSNTFKAFPVDAAASDYITAKNIDDGVDNWVGFGDPADCYKLVMTNAGTLTLGLTGLSGDVNLSLLDGTGKVLKTSANKGLTGEAISMDLLTGTYYVNVAPVSGVNNAAYTLTHAEKYFSVDKAANTWQAAADIATIDSWVGFGDPADCYKLIMDKNGTLTLGLTGLTGDATLSLLDAKGKVLKTSANKGNASESIANLLLTSGTYYVNVAPVKGVNSAAYSLTNVKTYFPDDKAANTWQTAKDISALDNWVGFGDSADCYKLAMTGAGTLTLNLTGLTGDANLSLLDSKGKVLKTSTNKLNAAEAITADLAVGTYYVNVAPVTGVNSAAYTLTHAEKYCPADKAENTWQKAKDIATLDNWVGFGDPADCYKLVMTNAGTLTLGLTGLSGDVNLSLLDSSGKVLKTSANKGLTGEAISMDLLTGTYYVNVAPVTGVNNAAYTLTHVEKYCPADKAKDTWQTAADIAGGVDNWVGFGDPADCYKLAMSKNGTLTLNLTGLSGDANLSLLDSKGKVLKTSANKLNTSEAITADLTVGTYYVNVAPVKGVNKADYTLTHVKTDFPDDTAGDSFVKALKVTTSGTVNEWLGFGDKDDYYKFELKTATTATFNLNGISSGSNVDLYLYDNNFKQIAVSKKTGNAAESITKALMAGTPYYVKATLAAKSANTNYALNFNIDPAAFKSGSLKMFSASSPLTSSSDVLGNDPLKKNQGMLAS